MPSSVAELAALAGLVEEYRPRLLAMVRRRLDPALAARLDAEDVLSEAFLEARRKYGRFREQAVMTPYAWLYRVVLDTLIEAWRRQNRSPRELERDMPFPEESSAQLVLGLVHTGTSPSAAAMREELRRAVRQVVESLRAADRQILWMRHQDGLSHQEIAAVLEVSENAAMVRYARALKRFKDVWTRLHPDHEHGTRP